MPVVNFNLHHSPNQEHTQQKRYRVILADPPWSYRNGGNGAAKNHYSTMTNHQLHALPVHRLADANAVLLMWATWPQLSVATKLGRHWGFHYVTGFPWVKVQRHPVVDVMGDLEARPVFGTGMWIRGCSEPMLIFRRGRVSPPKQSWLGLISRRFEHSRKPDDIYQYAESMEGPYLELFARRRRAGWDVFGDEVEESISLPDQSPST